MLDLSTSKPQKAIKRVRGRRNAYRILDRRKVSNVKLVVILINVLIWQVAAEEDAVDLVVVSGEVLQCSCCFALLDELINPLQVEAR